MICVSQKPCINLAAVPQSTQIDLCSMAILGTMEAMKTPEGRAAIEKGKKKYFQYLAEQGRPTP